MVIEKGSIVIKTKGRKAGSIAKVLSVEGNYAIIEGEKIKKKKCNLLHLIPIKK